MTDVTVRTTADRTTVGPVGRTASPSAGDVAARWAAFGEVVDVQVDKLTLWPGVIVDTTVRLVTPHARQVLDAAVARDPHSTIVEPDTPSDAA